MKARIHLISFFVFFIILNPAYAQELCGTAANPCGDNWKNFDYHNQNADISNIPPDEVNIQQVIDNRRGKELTVEQIKANFDKIENLKDTDLEKARLSIYEKYQVVVDDFGQSASIKNGILKANFGKQDHITLTSNMYKDGYININEKGEVIFVPKEETKKLDIAMGDSLIVSDLKNPATFQKHDLQGTFKFNEDGTIIFLKGQNAIIDGIQVKAESNDVNLCNIKSDCSGNYLFIAEDGLVANGMGFSLGFLGDNKFFKVWDSKETDPLFQQNDFLQINLGNDKKNGKIEVNILGGILPKIKTDGFVRIENDENSLSVDGIQVKKELFKKPKDNPLVQAERGSVQSSIIADNDDKKVYIFDESQNMHILSAKTFEDTNKKRTELLGRGLLLTGYFSSLELDIFRNELNLMEKNFDIDFKKLNMPSGTEDKLKLELFELDKRKRPTNEEAMVPRVAPTLILWLPLNDLNNLKTGRVVGDFKGISLKEGARYYQSIGGHEFGHVIEGLSSPYSFKERLEDESTVSSSPFQDKFKEKAEEFGFKFKKEYYEGSDKAFKLIPESAPDGISPSDYSKTDLPEYIAEIFRTMLHNPKWFTDSYNGGLRDGTKIIKLSKPVSPETMKQRQALRDLWLEELKKYKKDK